MSPISINPKDMVEGGAVPVDQNLTWKKNRFVLFDYDGKGPQTTALRIDFVADGGEEHPQHYSVGNPDRFMPTEDGKSLVAVGTAQALSKSSNFFYLMDALINAGFPENKLDEASNDVSILDNLYTYNIGMPAPTRSGLAANAPAADGKNFPKILSIPRDIIKLPWEKGGKKAVAGTGKKTAATDADTSGLKDKILAVVGRAVDAAEDGTVTKENLAVFIFGDEELAADIDRDDIASAVFDAKTTAILLGGGFSVKGDVISRK